MHRAVSLFLRLALQPVWLLLIAALLLWARSFHHFSALDLRYRRLKPSVVALQLRVEIVRDRPCSTFPLQHILAWPRKLLHTSFGIKWCLRRSSGAALAGQDRLGYRSSDLGAAWRCGRSCFLLLDLHLLEPLRPCWLPSLRPDNIEGLGWLSRSIWLLEAINRGVLRCTSPRLHPPFCASSTWLVCTR